jgi:PAS domain-containing protein
MFVFTYQKQFKPEDLDLLQAFAGQAGVALDKARLFTEVSRVRDRMQTVLNSVRDGIGLFSADGRLTIVNPAVHELLGVDLAAYVVAGDGFNLTFDELQAQLHTEERLERSRNRPTADHGAQHAAGRSRAATLPRTTDGAGLRRPGCWVIGGVARRTNQKTEQTRENSRTCWCTTCAARWAR